MRTRPLPLIIENVICHKHFQSPNVKTFKEPRNRFQGINSASLCSLAGGTITLFLLGS
jgi:hypothetical protein